MVMEVAQFEISAGAESAFEAAVAQGAELFKSARGCQSMRLERSQERPSHYFLFIEWETVEDHTVHFRNSPEAARWRELIGPHFTDRPSVEHLQPVLTGV